MNPVLPYVGLYGLYVLYLNTTPGPWREWKAGTAEGAAVDPWSLQHVLWGALGQRMGITGTQMVGLASLNEVGEYWIRQKRPDLLWGTPESVPNVALDVVFTVGGWALAEWLLGKKS